MKYTISITEKQFSDLKILLTDGNHYERSAFLLCNISKTPDETRLIADLVRPISKKFVESKSPSHISVRSGAFMEIFNEATSNNMSMIYVHSHPNGVPNFSKQDDKDEKSLFRTTYIKLPNGTHGSLVISDLSNPAIQARIWQNDGTTKPISRIRIIGAKTTIFDATEDGLTIHKKTFDRQVKAFGEDLQDLLGKLNIGVVGLGGTGSAVFEQLVRLGVGTLTVIDNDIVSETNLTRIHGSTYKDIGKYKIEVAKDMADSIGFGTKIIAIKGRIYEENIAKQLRDCDFVFSCTDDHMGRSLLAKLASWYYIPVIDLAVSINSDKDLIKEIVSRISILLPGNPCLDCSQRVTSARKTAEMRKYANPSEYESLKKESYVEDLDTEDPSVIMFTTYVASEAVIEFMNLIAQFKLSNDPYTEIIHFICKSSISKNNRKSKSGCYCSDEKQWGKGDQPRFLDRNLL